MSDQAGESGSGWKRVLGDRSVGTKIMIAVLVVAVFSIADGLFALSSLGATNQQVKTGYQMNGQLNTIGNLRAAVNRTWLAMDDYLLADTAAERATAQTAITTAQGQATDYATAYQGMPVGTRELATVATFQTSWTQYGDLLSGKVLPAAARGDRAQLKKLRTGDLAMVMKAIRADLTTLADLTVQAGAAEKDIAESRYHSTKRWVIALLAGSAVLGLLLALGVTRMIVALWWAEPGGTRLGVDGVVALTAFTILLFAWTEPLHNALLLRAAGEERAALASGMGLAMGNGISVLMLVGVLWAFALPGQVDWGWVPRAPLLGLDPKTFEPARITGPIVGIALLLGSLPLMLLVSDAPRTGLSLGAAVRAGFGDLRRAVGMLREAPEAAKFLLARLIYTDGKTAVIFFGGVYAAGTMGWNTTAMLAYGILLSVFAVAGGLLAPRLDDALGARNAILVEIAVTVAVIVALTGINPRTLLFVPHPAARVWDSPVFATDNELAFLALVVISAVSITAAYASSRTFMARLAPPGRTATFFGLYALSGNVTLWLGSALVGLVTTVTGSTKLGFASPVLLLVIGGLLLTRVRARG